jgi:hypothetical protein
VLDPEEGKLEGVLDLLEELDQLGHELVSELGHELTTELFMLGEKLLDPEGQEDGIQADEEEIKEELCTEEL